MLHIAFSGRPGTVHLSSDSAHSEDLQRLRIRFPSGRLLSKTLISVSLDDLLASISELAAWPAADHGDVQWQAELLRLVEGTHADAQLLDAELQRNLTTREGVPDLSSWWSERLTPLQRESVAHLLRLAHGANFSVPGAGKTRVTLATFSERRSEGQVQQMLVVAPKSASEAWVTETRECLPETTIASMVSNEVPIADIVLINYERLPGSLPVLQEWLSTHQTMLVLDEAHRMKRGPGGVWGAACYELAPLAEHRMILSGTPAPNSAADLENLFGFVWPGEGRRRVRQAVGERSLALASQRLRPLFTRITKEQLGLPPYEPHYVPIELPPLHREIYDALTGATDAFDADADLNSVGKIAMYMLMAATTPALLAVGSSRYEPLEFQVPPLNPPPGSSLANLMRDLPDYELSPKYAETAAIVRLNAESGRKTLVWSTFVRNITSLATFLHPFNPAVIHGGTLDREQQLKKFRTDSDCSVLITNPATLGEGVSLHHECHEAIYVDRDFAAGRYLQSLDRIHRLGLAPDTITRVHILVASETIDEVVRVRLEEKVRFLLEILNDSSVRELTDLDEAPPAYSGMNADDRAALLTFLKQHAAS